MFIYTIEHIVQASLLLIVLVFFTVILLHGLFRWIKTKVLSYFYGIHEYTLKKRKLFRRKEQKV